MATITEPPPSEDEDFWLEIHAMLLKLVCLVEKRKLHRKCTTADMRRIAKAVIQKAEASGTTLDLTHAAK